MVAIQTQFPENLYRGMQCRSGFELRLSPKSFGVLAFLRGGRALFVCHYPHLVVTSE